MVTPNSRSIRSWLAIYEALVRSLIIKRCIATNCQGEDKRLPSLQASEALSPDPRAREIPFESGDQRLGP